MLLSLGYFFDSLVLSYNSIISVLKSNLNNIEIFQHRKPQSCIFIPKTLTLRVLSNLYNV